MRDRWLRGLLAVALIAVAPGAPAAAQSGLGHLEDATVVPRGLFRLRAITVWSRFDSRFTATGEESLGAPFTSPALGQAQIPALQVVQALTTDAAAQPFTLSLGQSRLDARARYESVPVGVEYGLTRRITIGVEVPIVRRRVAVQFQLDSTGATVGPNLHGSLASAAATNALVQSQFAAAASQLQNRLAACRANPAASGCAALLSREADALELIAASQGFATTVGSLYGTSGGEGAAFVPRAGSDAQTQIELRVAAFNARYRDLLGAGSDLLTALPFGAPGPAGSAELQRYLTGVLGLDSLASQERSGFGDVAVSVRMLLLERIPSPQQRVAARLTAGLGYRFGTGSQQSPSPLVDLRLGGVSDVVEGRAALDVATRRIGLLATGDVALAIGAADPLLPVFVAGAGPDYSGLWVGLHVAPRVHVAEPLAVHGAWSYRRSDLSREQQLVGGGVTFSTMESYRRGGPLPLEMRFTHLESVSGSAGQPKFFRDQIELRIYFGRR